MVNEIKDLFKVVIEKIEEQEKIIAEARDKLQEIYDDLYSLTESINEGDDSLKSGIWEIKNAIELLSQRV